MPRSCNLNVALLADRSRWLVRVDSACSTVALLIGIACLILCARFSSVDRRVERSRTCVIFEIDLRSRLHKAEVRVHRCSDNWSWPLPRKFVNVQISTTKIRLQAKWSTIHFPGRTFPSRMVGWHYVPIANVSSVKCLLSCSTARPKFLGYEFKPKSFLPFL